MERASTQLLHAHDLALNPNPAAINAVSPLRAMDHEPLEHNSTRDVYMKID